MNQRLQRLNFIALIIVIFYTVFVVKFLSTRTIVNPLVDHIVVFLTSVGFYQIIIDVLYRIVCGSKTALKLYWGRQFLDGLWYYHYVREGKDADPKKIYFGVWRFEQDLFRTKVSGIDSTTPSWSVRESDRSQT